jgi:hypothetical protein
VYTVRARADDCLISNVLLGSFHFVWVKAELLFAQMTFKWTFWQKYCFKFNTNFGYLYILVQIIILKEVVVVLLCIFNYVCHPVLDREACINWQLKFLFYHCPVKMSFNEDKASQVLNKVTGSIISQSHEKQTMRLGRGERLPTSITSSSLARRSAHMRWTAVAVSTRFRLLWWLPVVG